MTLMPWLPPHACLICKMCKSEMNSHLLALQFRMSPQNCTIAVNKVIRNHLHCIIIFSLALTTTTASECVLQFLSLSPHFLLSFYLRLSSIFFSDEISSQNSVLSKTINEETVWVWPFCHRIFLFSFLTSVWRTGKSDRCHIVQVFSYFFLSHLL